MYLLDQATHIVIGNKVTYRMYAFSGRPIRFEQYCTANFYLYNYLKSYDFFTVHSWSGLFAQLTSFTLQWTFNWVNIRLLHFFAKNIFLAFLSLMGFNNWSSLSLNNEVKDIKTFMFESFFPVPSLVTQWPLGWPQVNDAINGSRNWQVLDCLVSHWVTSLANKVNCLGWSRLHVKMLWSFKEDFS